MDLPEFVATFEQKLVRKPRLRRHVRCSLDFDRSVWIVADVTLISQNTS
jgi:hypothetical protein